MMVSQPACDGPGGFSNRWKRRHGLFPIIGTLLLALNAEAVDWEKFLERQDVVSTALPDTWMNGAFVGNGLLGAMIYSDATNALGWEIGRSDVVDHRKGDDNPLVNKARLPIGFFHLAPAGRITNGFARVDLWNAEARGVIETDKGSVTWRSFAHATEEVLVVELTASSGERAATFSFAPAVSETSRPANKGKPKDYKPNPPSPVSEEGDMRVCVQPLLESGGYATAWRDMKIDDDRRRLFIGVGYSWPGDAAKTEAVEAVRKAATADFASLEKAHRRWWHTFYPQSFVSIPDAKLESLYWVQMYKLASATRADRPALDLMGPWYHESLWPGIWWNLNIQLAYYPVYTANRLELGESLCRMLDDATPALIANAKHYKQWDFKGEAATIPRVTSYDCAGGMWKGQNGCPEVGNLPWACQNYWRQCRYAGDDTRLRDRLFPLLKRAVNFYLTIMEKGGDGKWHLPCTYSPELWFAPDCNYDLASFRWGLETLVATDERLGLGDPGLPRWKETLANLTPFPADTNGFMVGRDVPFMKLHRHYSHLLMIYPYYTVNWDQPENRELIRTSVDHWSRSTGAFAGYSYSGAASMLAGMGRGDEALKLLHEFVARQVHPNTMYTEGGTSPCIESPLSAAQSIHDMLLQSWGGRIRIFPGVPSAWRELSFGDLRTEGAFLVSAAREDGATKWVRVKSLAGERCVVRPALEGDVKCTVPMQRRADGDYELELKRGGEAILYTGGTIPDCRVAPVASASAGANPFGLKARAAVAPPR